jgi:hypothetical protein
MNGSLKLLIQSLPAVFIVVVCTFSIVVSAEESKAGLRRFAFIAGSNDGGPSRIPLRYAHKDAKDVARVLTQLGGVDQRDSVILLEPDRFDFEAGMERMHGILLKEKKESKTRVELVFYYSGHSDEQGLMLGDDLLTYRELRDAIGELPADVRIAILDSCSSGALTRGKGGTRRAPFLLDTSVEVEGYAYLTSASEDEAAQESDRVGGSFFTHYLVSGLRGAADHNRDKKVTLQEAYQYAFNETLARTESTQAGPQHPGYDFQLKGSGDLVLTDLRGTSALLVVDQEIEGRIFIRNRKSQLVAEINKPGGNPVSVGLDPGIYELTAEIGRNRFRGTVSLAHGKATMITSQELSKMALEKTLIRGDEPLPEAVGNAPPEPKQKEQADRAGKMVNRPFRIGLFPGVNLPPRPRTGEREINRVSLNIIGYGHDLNGFEAGLFANIRRYNVRGAQISPGINMVFGTVHGFQGAGMFNLSLGDFRGFRGAGMFNFSKGSSKGFLGAGMGNIVHGPSRGFEGAGFVNFNTRSGSGFQGAGFVNINGASAYGFQGAGFVNFNLDTIRGAQLVGFVNVSARGESTGLQAAGFTNYADALHGAQLSGFANVTAHKVRGAQISAFNFAQEVKGTQIGIVNIASKRLDGAAIGLINYAGNGIFAPTLWTSDTSAANLGLKMGSKYVYGIFGMGVHPVEDEQRFTLIYGIGGHIDIRRFWVEIDATIDLINDNWMWDEDEPWKDVELGYIYKFRPTLGFRIIDELSVFAGPTLNTYMSEKPHDDEWIPALWTGKDDSGNYYRLSIGYNIGIQWSPRFGDHNSTD